MNLRFSLLSTVAMAARESAVVVLPEDVMDEILLRLPVKSILRFESVCKPWKSKFHSTSFIQFYQQSITKSETKTAHTMRLEDLYKMAPTFWDGKDYRQRPIPEISAIGPLNNGIYCLTAIHTGEITPFLHLWRCKIALCNPGIRHFKFLPPIPSSRFLQKLSGIPPDKIHVVFGFNRILSNGEYKVVVVVNHRESQFKNSYLVLVYSSNSDKWERLVYYMHGEKKVGPPCATRVFTQRLGEIVTPTEVCSQKLLNGCWHWVVRYDGYFAILTFNFASQSFHIMKGPDIGVVNCDDLSEVDVVVLHDHLTVIYRRQVSVWMMMEYGVERSWTVKFKAGPRKGLSSLYRIDYSVDHDGKEGGSDGVFIEKMFFTLGKDSSTPDIISFDRHGGHQVFPRRYHPKKNVSFSTVGISSYKETLERPC